MIKIIVAGCRNFNDYERIIKCIDDIIDNHYHNKDIEIVSGRAYGVDRLGERYAVEHNIPIKTFPADWKSYGKSAGHIRNYLMAEYADVLIAFWDGESKGTKHMIDLAELHKLKVRVITY